MGGRCRVARLLSCSGLDPGALVIAAAFEGNLLVEVALVTLREQLRIEGLEFLVRYRMPGVEGKSVALWHRNEGAAVLHDIAVDPRLDRGRVVFAQELPIELELIVSLVSPRQPLRPNDVVGAAQDGCERESGYAKFGIFSGRGARAGHDGRDRLRQISYISAVALVADLHGLPFGKVLDVASQLGGVRHDGAVDQYRNNAHVL